MSVKIKFKWQNTTSTCASFFWFWKWAQVAECLYIVFTPCVIPAILNAVIATMWWMQGSFFHSCDAAYFFCPCTYTCGGMLHLWDLIHNFCRNQCQQTRRKYILVGYPNDNHFFVFFSFHRNSSGFCVFQSNKPMMERRRRERINNSLETLKKLVLESLKKDVSTRNDTSKYSQHLILLKSENRKPKKLWLKHFVRLFFRLCRHCEKGKELKLFFPASCVCAVLWGAVCLCVCVVSFHPEGQLGPLNLIHSINDVIPKQSRRQYDHYCIFNGAIITLVLNYRTADLITPIHIWYIREIPSAFQRSHEGERNGVLNGKITGLFDNKLQWSAVILWPLSLSMCS